MQDERIWMIGGSNYIEGYNPHRHDYIFSHNMFIHGWASWKNRWNSVEWNNVNFKEMIDEGVFDAVFDTKQQRQFHKDRILKYDNFVKKLIVGILFLQPQDVAEVLCLFYQSII